MKNWNKNNPIAEFVRNQRKENKLTQIQLADYSGVGLRFVRDLEQGKPNLMTKKVNILLLMFGHSLKPMPLTADERAFLNNE